MTAAAGSVVNLDGIGSFDVDGSALSYQWQLTHKPATSQANIGEKGQSQTGLYLDVDGGTTSHSLSYPTVTPRA